MMLFNDHNHSAVIDGQYRYLLARRTGLPSVRKLGIICHNPSTADAERDDPTSRRITSFARSWGFGSYVLGNIFAYRATDPKVLPTVDDPVGPRNRSYLYDIVEDSDMVVIACGTPKWRAGLEHAWQTIHELARRVDLHCIRVTDGLPHHPLYLPGDLKPVLFREKAP